MKKLVNKVLNSFGYKISKQIAKDQVFFETQKKLTNSKERQVIFDVGAYDGETAKNYNNYFNGNCDIYSFEPFKKSFEILNKKVQPYNNIKTFNLALGAKDELSTFHVNNFTATNSLLPSSEEGLKNWANDILVTKDIIKVPTKRIDTFMAEQNINHIDILKMDTQGAEYLVLEGAEKSLKENKIKIIISELSVLPSYEGQKDLDEMLRLYTNYGFELYTFFNSVDVTNQRLKYIDAVFISKNK